MDRRIARDAQDPIHRREQLAERERERRHRRRRSLWDVRARESIAAIFPRALEDVLSGRRRPDIAAAQVWARRFDGEQVATVYERSYDELCPAVAS